MPSQLHELHYSQEDMGGVTLIEAAPSPARDALLVDWLAEAADRGAETWLLPCAPESGGIWAGLADLIDSVIPRVEQAAPHLLITHRHEIGLILPRFRPAIDVVRPLTDTAEGDERTRNYPADRAYRSLHGLIDLLTAWHHEGSDRPWAIGCTEYDRANGLVHRFFSELIRRRGRALDLQLLVGVDDGSGDRIATDLAAVAMVKRFRPSLPAVGAPLVSAPEMTARAVELEALVQDDPAAEEAGLPRLIHYWEHSITPERALRWRVKAMLTYNHYGLYEASLEYSRAVEMNLDRLYDEHPGLLFLAVTALFFCWVPLGREDRARSLVEGALDRLDPADLPRSYYLLAMLHARFLSSKDFDKADAYLHTALDLIASVDMAEDERHFMTVFLMNGVALVRVRQRRPHDALAICQAGLDRLNKYLSPDRHRLHRSVLLYNIAQVYAQIGPYDLALEYFGQTMEMDPNYSEYYNERGAVYFRLGYLAEAEADFLRAIELSPPYAEVWINLGQCYRAMGRMREAVDAYSRALDLEPGSTLSLVGRGQAAAELGASLSALDDYNAVLAIEAAQPLVLANRATLHYEAGRMAHALEDLDNAVALAPGVGELYQNRAVVFRDMGRPAEAARDLGVYLKLCPDADDRADVEQQLQSLLAMV